MLVIQNIERIGKHKFNITKKKVKKNQIFLYDTQRRFDEYVNKLVYRNNGKYTDIPHFIVTKLGQVYQLFDTNYSSVTFDNYDIDKRMVKIAVENLGWLNKNTITGVMNNWIGDAYRAEPYVKNWRNYYFWDRYTDVQMEAIVELCRHIMNKHNMYKQIVPSQGFFENAFNFNGIVCKSNFSNIYTDINPSFNFGVFFNNAQEKN
jgi:N-acetylmuramoyl-L-alanine amidase